jgi:hypothetical protein
LVWQHPNAPRESRKLTGYLVIKARPPILPLLFTFWTEQLAVSRKLSNQLLQLDHSGLFDVLDSLALLHFGELYPDSRVHPQSRQ